MRTQHEGDTIADDRIRAAVDEPSNRRPDGRLERRRRNRLAVIDEYISLMQHGAPEPTNDELARLAGVSERSVFRYFDNRSSLLEAAAARLIERSAPTLAQTIEASSPLSARIDHLVRIHVAAHDELGLAATRVFAREPDVRTSEIGAFRAMSRARVTELFRPELDQLDSHSREQVIDAVTIWVQFETMQLVGGAAFPTRQSLSTRLRTQLHHELTACHGDHRNN